MENILYHIERYENVQKSKYDNNSYRGLTLPNKMRVLLISDPTTTVAACALTVNVGSFFEPDDLPGLANLCSRVLVLGTHKYPTYKGFENFLSNHNGNHQVTTKGDQTSYYFKINTHHFKDALLQYVQFFLTPLFKEDWIEEEINSLDLDHRKSLSDYFTCLEEFIKFTVHNHPYKRFSHGNKESLKTIPAQNGINIRNSLLDFFNKYYSAHIMSLCVLSNGSLNDIEDTIMKLFHEIPYKNIVIPEYEHLFHDPSCTKWNIIPKQNTTSLILVFSLPELRADMWVPALNFILTLLEYEGKGSLTALLKEMRLCNKFITHHHSCARGMSSLLLVEITTFENDIIYDDIVIELLFQYLNMINEESKVLMSPNEPLPKLHKIFRDQIKEYSKKTFHDYEEIINIAEILPDYSLEEVILKGRSESCHRHWGLTQGVVLWLLNSYLSPENVRVYLFSKQYENKINEISPKWNGEVMYKKMKIPKETISKWKNIINTNFHLPIFDEFKEQISFK